MFNYFVVCAQNLAPFVLEELKSLNIDGKVSATGVTFEGSIEDAYQVCLWSRCASRVLVELKTGQTNDIDKIYDELQNFQWSLHLGENQTFSVAATTKRAKHINTLYASQKIKDAIVDYFKEHFNTRPNVDKNNPDLHFQLHISEKSYILYLDLSGESLHKRGFRTQAGIAPIKETLAAALLYKSQWPKLAAENKDFIDPMCGAGTLLIEAAMMAQDIAPGLSRHTFGFNKWRQHDPLLWKNCYEQALDRSEQGKMNYKGHLFGIDRDAKMIKISHSNICSAKLEDKITLKNSDFVDFKPNIESNLNVENCLLVSNPPYGERLGNEEALVHLYSSLGTWLKENFLNTDAGIIITDSNLGKVMGLRAIKVNKFFNGPLECLYLQFRLEEKYFVDREKADLRKQEKELQEVLSDGGEFFKNRMLKNKQKWTKWAKKQSIEAYRIYDADLPEFNVAIDFYKEALIVQEYAAPKTIDADKASQRIKKILSIISIVYSEINPKNIHFKKRERQKGKQQYQRLNTTDHYFQIQEKNAFFWVNLSDYLDTGLFLDHRNIRALIGKMAKDKRFLNLFAYTGSASVYAALAGAMSTLTIDMSSTYLHWAQENFDLNEIKMKDSHEFIQANVIEWLEKESNEITQLPDTKKSDYQFDLIFMDPPSFSNSKRMEGILDIQRDHVSLISRAMALLDRDGDLIFSTNLRRFKLSEEILQSYKVQDISQSSLPEDFARNHKIRQCFIIKHLM